MKTLTFLPPITKPEQFRKRVNNILAAIIPTFVEEIPIDNMFNVIKEHDGLPVQEDGTEWSGILCGAEGQTKIQITHPLFSKGFFLHLSWYKMQSGRYEIVVYVS